MMLTNPKKISLKHIMGLTDRYLNYFMEGLVIFLVALLVSLTALQVAMRYLFNAPLTWSEEICRWLLIWLTFFGSCVALYKRAHLDLGISIFSLLKQKDSNSIKKDIAYRSVTLFINLLVLIFIIIFIITGLIITFKLWPVVLSSLPISAGYGYLVVPISGVVMFKFCLSIIISDLSNTKESDRNCK